MTPSRADAEQRMLEKLDRSLIEDVAPLLPVGVDYSEVDALLAFQSVWNALIVKLTGEAWKSTEAAVAEVRTRIPSFLRE